ncbi:MAG: Bacterial capsule synthesis protein PGAcap [Bacteroidetes bacterium]|nr:MAG: Bacterial capsule synthesis protein PGAcap [Bacteroidota bacterium]
MKEDVKVLITGDFYGGGRTDEFIRNGKHSELIDESITFLGDNDLTIVNLESALIQSGTPIAKTGPAIKADPLAAKALKTAGFNTITLANNHIMDFGHQGLIKTIEVCQSEGLDFLGAGLNLEEAAKPLIRKLKGTTIALLNFCENEWSTTTGNHPGANPLELIANARTIASVRSMADFIVVVYHGGNELYSLPSPRLQATCRFFVDSGANLVACHHAHYYSGFETYNNGHIFYGLGNFIFDNPRFRSSKWNKGLALQFRIAADGSHDFNLFPFIQSDELPGLRMTTRTEKGEFEDSIAELNKIIGNQDALALEFDRFCRRSEKQYLNYLQPYSNRVLNALYKRGLLPSLLTSDKKRLYNNLIRCEAHRDVILNILKK